MGTRIEYTDMFALISETGNEWYCDENGEYVIFTAMPENHGADNNEVLDWCVKRLAGRFSNIYNGNDFMDFIFEKKSDASLFRLKWA